jgi:general secretion pathway protein A
MYLAFYKLQREPFSIAPDPHFLFMSERHREALAHLLYGLQGGGGFVLLTGEIGAGKTTVCRCFLDQVPKTCNVAYIFNPKLSVPELLHSVCEEFGITDAGPAPSIKASVDALNRFLLRSHAEGRTSVLVIDEAQALAADVLEQLRLLTNLETSERKLLQIVLIGQPELRGMLARPELEQLAQRVIARYHLGPLSAGETAQYIEHRLRLAGFNGPLPFDGAALRRIHERCKGVPRRINLLCDRALLAGYAAGVARVGGKLIDRAASEVFDDAPPQRRPVVLGLGIGAALVLAGLVWAWTWRTAPPAPTPVAAAASAVQVAAAASEAASAPAPAASVPQAVAEAASAPAMADAATIRRAAWRRESEAWQALAGAWSVTLAEADACAAARAQQLQCFKGTVGLNQVRQLGRPGLLTLSDEQGRPLYAVLTGLGTEQATLQAGTQHYTVSTLTLAALWRGEFAALWRTPPGFGDTAAAATLNGWLRAQLDHVEPALKAWPLPARVQAFQVAQGLLPDGVAGPLTLMQLNRASGVEEPRLQSER